MKTIITFIVASLIIINVNAQKAMSNHTDVRVPPARPVRPVNGNNIESRKIPVLRIDHDDSEELTISNAINTGQFSMNNVVSLNITENGSYRIFKGDYSVDVFYKSKKEVTVDKKAKDNVIMVNSSDSVELDGKTFVCGVDNMDEHLKKFSGENNDETGFYLNIPDDQDKWFVNHNNDQSAYEIVFASQDFLTIKFHKQINSQNEQKNMDGLMIVDPASGIILAKNIRVKRIGTLLIKGKKFSYENHSSLKMGVN